MGQNMGLRSLDGSSPEIIDPKSSCGPTAEAVVRNSGAMPPALAQPRLGQTDHSALRSRIKRTFDLIVSAAAILAALPLLLIAAVAWSLTGRPLLFRQERTGLGMRNFTIYKLRTMSDARGPDGERLSDVERTTRLGRLLRTTSLDELPQLWNVLRGDMSLIGPRPQVPYYFGETRPEHARRSKVRPGLTGWAQVNGRNSITRDEKLRLDLWYVDNWSLILDLRILARTITTVVECRGGGCSSRAGSP